MREDLPSSLVSQLERITALETQMVFLLEEQKKTNTSLDELLGLKNKGIGAFWLASALAGTGAIGILVTAIEWIRGVFHG